MMARLRRFLASMTGRLFVILLVGMLSAAIGATLLAEAHRRQEFEQQNLMRMADRLQGFVALLESNPELRARLLETGWGGPEGISYAEAPRTDFFVAPELRKKLYLLQTQVLIRKAWASATKLEGSAA